MVYGGIFPLVTTDIWWHLAAAREMLVQRSFLYTDVFSITAYGYTWFNVHWLFQIIMYAVYALGGIAALIGMRVLLFIAAWVLFFMIGARRRTSALGMMFMVVSAFCVRSQMLMRPGLFTLVFIALFLMFIEQFRASGNIRWLWLLIPVQLLWVNMQGLYLIGPILLSMVLVGEFISFVSARLPLTYITFIPQFNRKRIVQIGVALAGVLAACMVNPYGWHILALPFKLFGVITPVPYNPFSTGVAENAPVWLGVQGGIEDSILKLLGMVVVVLFVVNRKQLVPFRILLFTSFLLLAVMAGRNIPLYAALLIPLSMQEWHTLMQRGTLLHTSTRFWKIVRTKGMLLVGIGAGVSMVIMYVQKRQEIPIQGNVVPFRNPIGATQYLHDHPITGSMFNAARQGGYLLWNLYPRTRVFTDGRFTIRPGAYLHEYLAMLDNPNTFEYYFKKYAITHAVVPLDRYQRYSGLAASLAAHPAWKLVYTDGADAVFVEVQQSTYPAENPESAVVHHRVEKMFTHARLVERALGNLAVVR